RRPGGRARPARALDGHDAGLRGGGPGGRDDRAAGNRPVRMSRIALVMSGGGARGPYEVGVLSALMPELERRGEKPSIVVGTSVGAFNAAFVAASAHRPAVEALEDGIRYWHELVWTDSLEPIGASGEEPARRRLPGQLP